MKAWAEYHDWSVLVHMLPFYKACKIKLTKRQQALLKKYGRKNPNGLEFR